MATTAYYDLATTILGLAVSALGTGANAAPDRQYVTIGQVAWDSEQLTVNIGPISFRQTNPDRQPSIVYTLALLRCAETIKDSNSGTPKLPSASALDAEGSRFAVDAYLLSTGIDPADFGLDCDQIQIGTLAPLGPNGGLAGWSWPFTIIG